jgi:hypothetical protein
MAAASIGAATVPDGPIARLNASAGVLTWTPASARNALSLSVAGDGVYLEQTFEAGKAPFLNRETPDGDRLPDGPYTWELRAVPNERPRAEDKEMPIAKRSAAFARRAVVQSGSFVVINGAFATAAEKSE